MKGHGFEINPYDKCISNKIINGKQCTIMFYVDDNKISHEDPAVVDEILRILESHFGKWIQLGAIGIIFLGMGITFMKKKTVKIEMK